MGGGGGNETSSTSKVASRQLASSSNHHPTRPPSRSSRPNSPRSSYYSAVSEQHQQNEQQQYEENGRASTTFGTGRDDASDEEEDDSSVAGTDLYYINAYTTPPADDAIVNIASANSSDRAPFRHVTSTTFGDGFNPYANPYSATSTNGNGNDDGSDPDISMDDEVDLTFDDIATAAVLAQTTATPTKAKSAGDKDKVSPTKSTATAETADVSPTKSTKSEVVKHKDTTITELNVSTDTTNTDIETGEPKIDPKKDTRKDPYGPSKDNVDAECGSGRCCKTKYKLLGFFLFLLAMGGAIGYMLLGNGGEPVWTSGASGSAATVSSGGDDGMNGEEIAAEEEVVADDEEDGSGTDIEPDMLDLKTPSPTSEPTAATTFEPTVVPTAGTAAAQQEDVAAGVVDPSCTNDETWLMIRRSGNADIGGTATGTNGYVRTAKGCTWLAKDPATNCDKRGIALTDDGTEVELEAAAACPLSCGTCDPMPADVTAANETTTTDIVEEDGGGGVTPTSAPTVKGTVQSSTEVTESATADSTTAATADETTSGTVEMTIKDTTDVTTAATAEEVVAVLPALSFDNQLGPHSRCKGDCDSDADCQEGLVCLERANEAVPGCSGVADEEVDYCVRPEDLLAQEEAVADIVGIDVIDVTETTIDPTSAPTASLTLEEDETTWDDTTGDIAVDWDGIVDDADYLCPTTDEGVDLFDYRTVAGNVAMRLGEASGLAASRVNPHVVYTHEDYKDFNEFYAIDTRNGNVVGDFVLRGATNIDWEDMAVGPGPEKGASYVYIGDIGDNWEKRTNIVIYRVKEPSINADGSKQYLPEWDQLTLTYHDYSAHNSEAFFFDPTNQIFYIIRKESGKIWRTPTKWGSGDASMTLVRDLDVNSNPNQVIVAADMSADGRELLVKYYGTVRYYCREPGESMTEILSQAEPLELPYSREPRGEAVAFAANRADGYYTLSENNGNGYDQPLYHYARVMN